MTKRIVAIRRYAPRLKQERRIEPDEFAEEVAVRSVLSEGAIRHALSDVSRTLLILLREGHSVRLEGLGLLTPGIDAQGRFTVRLKPDRKLRSNVKDDRSIKATIVNREHIGKCGDQLVALWDAENPEDPVV